MLGCMQNRFKTGFRPLIELDGCFLKEYVGGQLLSDVRQDGNNHILVITLVNAVNRENSKWFLTLLYEDFRDYVQHGSNLILNMQKVINN